MSSDLFITEFDRQNSLGVKLGIEVERLKAPLQTFTATDPSLCRARFF
jgi:hypothetical protein